MKSQSSKPIEKPKRAACGCEGCDCESCDCDEYCNTCGKMRRLDSRASFLQKVERK